MDSLRPYIVPIIAMLVTVGIALVLRRSKPLLLDDSGGTIRPDRWTAWLTVVGGATMFAGGVAGLFILDGQRWGAGVLSLMGLAAGGFMLPSVTSVHAVHWDRDGIDGPSRTFGPTLGLARTKIAWADLTTSGSTMTGYTYIQATDGRRVYWSHLYKGYGAFEAIIAEKTKLSITHA